MYNLIQYSDIYLKTLRSLWQYYEDGLALENNKNTTDFAANKNNSISFTFKQKITGQTGNNGTKNVEIIVPLKYLSNLRRTLEMLLINCEISVMLNWSKKCFLVAGTAANQEPKFTITDTRLYVQVVALTIHDNVKLLKQPESGFKRTINWKKHQSKITTQTQNGYIDFLIDPGFHEVNRILVLSFEILNDRESYKRYFLPKSEKIFSSKIRNKKLPCYDWWTKPFCLTNKKVTK